MHSETQNNRSIRSSVVTRAKNCAAENNEDFNLPPLTQKNGPGAGETVHAVTTDSSLETSTRSDAASKCALYRGVLRVFGITTALAGFATIGGVMIALINSGVLDVPNAEFGVAVLAAGVLATWASLKGGLYCEKHIVS